MILYHTNDFHNHLTEAQAARLRLLRESAEDEAVLLDAGDAIGAGNITFRPGGEPILERMSEAGYDAMTIGNREFHVSRIGFQCKLSRARFPVLCANVRAASSAPFSQVPESANGVLIDEFTGNPKLPVRPYLLKELVSGRRIAVIGLTVPMVTDRMLARKVSAYVFDSPTEIARRLVPRLREAYRPDLLVALTHIGLRRDRELAEAVGGIDLIIGGHSHDVLEQGERVGDTLIVTAGSWARFVGRVDVSYTDGQLHGQLQMSASLEAL